MRLHRVTLRDFKGVEERTIAFAKTGVTIVEGPNESGKTTITDALDLLFDARDDSQRVGVVAARPVHRDASPEVIAELTAGPHRLVYAKRFDRKAGRRATTLTVEGPHPEQLTGRDAHERAGQLLSETVDLPLWSALRLQQGVALEQANLLEHASLAAALDAVAGGGQAGAREGTLFARVTAEFGRYHTPTGRQSQQRKELAEAFADAQDRADRLSQELDTLDALAEQAAALSWQLQATGPRLQAQRTQLGDLAERRAQTERLADEVERLRLADQVARGAHDRAIAELEARQRSVAEVERLDGELAALRQADATETPQLAHATEAREELQRDVTRLRSSRAAARDDAERTERRLSAARDARTLADLEQRIVLAGRAQEMLDQADRTLEATVVDDEVLERIHEAEAALVRARTSVRAQAPQVTVTALTGVEVVVDGERTNLRTADTVVHCSPHSLDLRIGEHATVEVRPGVEADAGVRAWEEAEEELALLLASAAVPDVPAARLAHRARREARDDRERADADLRRALGKMTATTLARRAELLRRRLEEEDLVDRSQPQAVKDAGGPPSAQRGTIPTEEELHQDAKRARLARARAEDELDEAVAALEESRRTLDLLTQERAVRSARLDGLVGRRQDASEALAAARAQQPDDALTRAVERSAAAVQSTTLAFGSTAETLASADLDGVREAHENAAAVAERLAQEERGLADELRDARAALDVRGEQGLHDAFAAAELELEQAKREHQRVEARAAASALLFARMSAHRDAARRAYGAPFREKLEAFGRIVFGDTFGVTLDEDLRIATRTVDGITLTFDRLSGGAREQLTVLSRLACAAIVSADGGVPLVLDDALGYSDPDRLARLGAAFRVGARDAQVVVLTCVPERYAHIGDATVVRLG